jgi:hypothetical protein
MTTPLERTSRRIVWGTWGCAAIVMAASAANAALTYGALGDNRALGLATGIAVDIGLCVALIGDRQLYVHGLSSTWGRALRITTAAMSLVLNTGIAVRDGHYFQALLHSFLPILLVVLTEYGQDVLLKFAALTRDAERAPQISDPGPSEPGSGGLGRPGSDHPSTRNAPLGSYSGGRPAERAATVLPARSGSDLPESPLRAGSTDHSPAAHAVPGSGPGWLPAGSVVTTPQAAPVGPVVPVGPTGSGQPKPARKPPAQADPKPARERPARTGPSSKWAGAAGRSEEQLVQAARELAARSDGPLTQYALRQAFGLGSTRAARLLGQLDPVPVGPARSNGQAQVKEAK